MQRNIQNAAERSGLQDILLGVCTKNLSKKNIGSAQNSLLTPAMSTAGDYAINGVLYTKAAASSLFSNIVVASAATSSAAVVSIPAGGAAVFVLTLDAAGNGYAIPATNGVLDKMGNAYGNGTGYVMTSTQVSSIVANPNLSAATVAATIQGDLNDVVWPVIPAQHCPVGLMTIVAGSISHLVGTTSFSLTASAAGSTLFTDIMTMTILSSPASQPFTG